MSLGVALSGGGAKGAAHIGVLQALKEENIQIDYIAGASSGSIVASLYAIGYSPMSILKMFKSYCKHISDYDKMVPFKILGTLFTGKIKVKGFVKGNNLEAIIDSYCHKKKITDITDVPMPLAIPTVDIKTGEIIYYLNSDIDSPKRKGFDDTPSYCYQGKIGAIVRASSSVPGVFEPKFLDGKYLVDGGVRMNCPISVLKDMGASKVLAITFEDNKQCDICDVNLVSVAIKSFNIMGHEIVSHELKKADFILNPKINDVSLLDCSKIQYAANAGYELTKKNIDKIKKALE